MVPSVPIPRKPHETLGFPPLLLAQLLFYPSSPLSPTIVVVVVVPAKKRNALCWHEFNSFGISCLPGRRKAHKKWGEVRVCNEATFLSHLFLFVCNSCTALHYTEQT